MSLAKTDAWIFLISSTFTVPFFHFHFIFLPDKIKINIFPPLKRLTRITFIAFYCFWEQSCRKCDTLINIVSSVLILGKCSPLSCISCTNASRTDKSFHSNKTACLFTVRKVHRQPSSVFTIFFKEILVFRIILNKALNLVFRKEK